MIRLWALWTSAVVLLLAISFIPLLNATAVSPALYVVTPLGTATGWAGVVFAAAQALAVFFTPVGLLTAVWAWRRRQLEK